MLHVALINRNLWNNSKKNFQIIYIIIYIKKCKFRKFTFSYFVYHFSWQVFTKRGCSHFYLFNYFLGPPKMHILGHEHKASTGGCYFSTYYNLSCALDRSDTDKFIFLCASIERRWDPASYPSLWLLWRLVSSVTPNGPRFSALKKQIKAVDRALTQEFEGHMTNTNQMQRDRWRSTDMEEDLQTQVPNIITVGSFRNQAPLSTTEIIITAKSAAVHSDLQWN